VDQTLAMVCLWGVPTFPKVLCESVEWIRRSRFGFGGVDPRVAVHPESPGLDRSDRCLSPVWPVLTLDSVLLGWTSWWVLCYLVLLLFRVWRVLELRRLVSWNWGFQTQTYLTSELHRPNRCRGFQWKLPSPARVTQLEV
jgi:hypothetical protein